MISKRSAKPLFGRKMQQSVDDRLPDRRWDGSVEMTTAAKPLGAGVDAELD